jgi:hypothetical protein
MMIEIDSSAATSRFQEMAERFPSMVKQNTAVADEHSFRTEMTEVTDECLHSDNSCTFEDVEDHNLQEEEEKAIYQQVEKEHTDWQQQRIEEGKEEDESFAVSASGSEELQATKSILRRHSDPIPIHANRSAWKVLPKPDMERLSRSVSNPEGGGCDKGQRRRTSGVVFKDVLIREYCQTVGDNPCVSYGPPISLDWDYEQFDSVGIDEYETSRGTRRTMRQMLLSYYQRRNLLAWQYGVSDEELKLAKRQANRSKSERAMTNFLMPAMIVETALESARRKAKRLVRGRKNKVPKTD